MWGGQSQFIDPRFTNHGGRLPANFRNYLALVFGIRGKESDKTISSFEWNRIGNHLGSVDIGANINIANMNLTIYRQFLYDDGSLYYGTNLNDGINGLRLKRVNQEHDSFLNFKQATFEYVYTGSQGGSTFDILNPDLRGRDNYFNHTQFLDGWTYFGRVIGTPFFTTDAETSKSLPRYGAGIANNRVRVFHFAVNALAFSKLDLTARLSFSRNFGTYNIPFPTSPNQFSGMLTASLPINLLGGMVVNGSVALDSGELLPNSAGFYLGLRKTGFFGRARQSIPDRPRSTPAPTTPNYRWP